jgi:hypothetical protein
MCKRAFDAGGVRVTDGEGGEVFADLVQHSKGGVDGANEAEDVETEGAVQGSVSECVGGWEVEGGEEREGGCCSCPA